MRLLILHQATLDLLGKWVVAGLDRMKNESLQGPRMWRDN